MTPVEEETLYQEIRNTMGPKVILEYVLGGGVPSLERMATIGQQIQDICVSKGVETGWFVKYAMKRQEARNTMDRLAEQAWGQPGGMPGLKKAREDEETRTKPYKCSGCQKRFTTSDDRNRCLELHKAKT